MPRVVLRVRNVHHCTLVWTVVECVNRALLLREGVCNYSGRKFSMWDAFVLLKSEGVERSAF